VDSIVPLFQLYEVLQEGKKEILVSRARRFSNPQTSGKMTNSSEAKSSCLGRIIKATI